MEGLSNFFRSLDDALNGIVLVVRAERNARIHVVAALVALALAIFFGVTNSQLVVIFLAIMLVFAAESINTALEKTLDMIEPGHSEQVRVIKDIAAGAVLITAIGAFAIGIAIFWPYMAKAL